jgi:threonine/homoserine efflux transporter RhtA
MQTENSPQYQDQGQLLSLMSSRHLFDLATVNLANVGALALSLSEAEQWIRVTGCLLAAIFTLLKIVETIRSLRK